MGHLHVMFFPFMAHGHMIPLLDMAKLFASRPGVKTTIITTPLNALVFQRAIDRTKQLDLGIQISLHIIKFPAVEAGLPEGCENADQITSDDLIPNFFTATGMLKQPLEHILQESRPDCLIADMFFPWSTDIAAKFNIPRLVFHGQSSFALSASHSLRVYKPFNNILSDSEPFILPNLPHEIKLIRTQLAPTDLEDPEKSSGFAKLIMSAIIDANVSSYGVIFNSFYELEPDYADHYRKVLHRRIWHVGPVSLCNRDLEDKSDRGKKAAIDEQECLKWLDEKKPSSVIYVCFGSVTNFTTIQLYEIAIGLEASGQDFIWVIRKVKENDEEWLPEGFEERVKGKGLIIKGWAPQVLILDHEAIGGFVTHCGWNSTLEGVCAGVPMVTWPFFADQFYNEKFVTEILRIGVGVGVRKWSRNGSGEIKREAIEKAVKSLMEGKEAEEMRRRGKELKEMARKAVEQGGSSHANLSALIDELTCYGSCS